MKTRVSHYVYIVILTGLIIGALPRVAIGQACCSAGVPLLGSLELPAMPAGQWQFALTYERNTLQDVVAGSERLDDSFRERIVNTMMLETSYGLSDRWSLSALVSMIQQRRSIQSPLSSNIMDRLDTRGIGDAVVLLKYNVMPLTMSTQRELTLGAGPKIPVGKHDLRSNGILAPADMQPGTGAWDAVAWAYFYQGFLPTTRLNVFGNVSARYTGTNSFDYRFGNEFITTLSTSYRTDTFFNVSMSLRYRNVTPDQRFGEDIANTGGQWFMVIPGINFKIAQDWTLRTTAQLPVYRELNGTQLTTSYRFSVSLFYVLNKSKSFDF